MGDVGKRSAMHKGRGSFQGLNQVRPERVLEQGCHGADGLQVACRNRLAFKVVAHDDAGKARLQVFNRGGQAENRHDFRSHGNVKSVLAGSAVALSAEPVHQKAQLAVIHVHAALPGNAPHIDAQCIALLNVVVEHGCQQVVGRPDGMEVTGKMQVDVLHGHHLSIPAAGCSALDAEYRPQGRLAQRDGHVLSDAPESIAQADGRGGLSLACRRRGDRGHQDQLSVLFRPGLEHSRVDLGLVAPIGLYIGFLDVGLRSDLLNGLHLTRLSNFNICHGFLPSQRLLALRVLYLKYCTAASNIRMS